MFTSLVGILHRNLVVPMYGAMQKLENKGNYIGDIFSITIPNEQSWPKFDRVRLKNDSAYCLQS